MTVWPALALGLLLGPGPAPASSPRPRVSPAARPARPPTPAPSPAADDAWRAALDLLYDGQTETAIARIRELEKERSTDPLGPYLHTLALVWRLEQRPETEAGDREFLAQSDRALRLAGEALAVHPEDTRALLARGATHGVRSRFHLFRLHRTDAAREAVRMREDLMAVREHDPRNAEALFGLGLYDYYADVLPRAAKVLRFLARMPGGDRQRGLARIGEAKALALLHRTEVQVQLYEIDAFYEDDPDAAAREMRDLRRRYPGSPLWALKLVEHLKDRMGLFEEAAAVAQEILDARRTHPNYASGAVDALARVALGDALLQAGQPAAARQALLPAKDGAPGLPLLAGQARLLLAQGLEQEGDREGALAHYKLAAASPDRDLRRRAEAALRSPMPAPEMRARKLLADAHRLRAKRPAEGEAAYREAHALWPGSREAALGTAEAEIAAGRFPTALRLVGDAGDAPTKPGWLRPWAWLLRAQLHDQAGEREEALALYRKVQRRPHGRPDLHTAASAGLRMPFAPPPARPAPRG